MHALIALILNKACFCPILANKLFCDYVTLADYIVCDPRRGATMNVTILA